MINLGSLTNDRKIERAQTMGLTLEIKEALGKRGRVKVRRELIVNQMCASEECVTSKAETC